MSQEGLSELIRLIRKILDSTHPDAKDLLKLKHCFLHVIASKEAFEAFEKDPELLKLLREFPEIFGILCPPVLRLIDEAPGPEDLSDPPTIE